MTIEVVDNVISDSHSRYLFDQISQLPWTFVPDLSLGHSDSPTLENCGFSHSFFLDETIAGCGHKQTKDASYQLIVPLLLESMDKMSISTDISKVFRCRARLTVNRQTSRQEQLHRDYSFPHWVLLYYVNSTDGDTVIFQNEQRVERISPRRGRVVLFDGNLLHASSTSTASPRIVLNTNLAR